MLESLYSSASRLDTGGICIFCCGDMHAANPHDCA
uniref:Uncharacterized protein n=1 Tax=Anguilla anguilla TaxID=7936 RepID=A0A0E9XY07_ANGAN